MGMNMHEQRRFQPTSTVVLEASLFICQTNSLVTTLLEHQCSVYYVFMDRTSASWWLNRFMPHTVSSI